MKILIKIHHSPVQRVLVELSDKCLIDEIRELINRGSRAKAIKTALAKGNIIRKVPASEIGNIEADLILTEKTAHYDQPFVE